MDPGAYMLRPASAPAVHPARHDEAALGRGADVAVAERKVVNVEDIVLGGRARRHGGCADRQRQQ